MNGFKKNKNGTTKRNVKPDIANDQLGENITNEYKDLKLMNQQKEEKKTK